MEVTDASKLSSKANCLCGAPQHSSSEEQGRIFLRAVATLETGMIIRQPHHWLGATSRGIDITGLWACLACKWSRHLWPEGRVSDRVAGAVSILRSIEVSAKGMQARQAQHVSHPTFFQATWWMHSSGYSWSTEVPILCSSASVSPGFCSLWAGGMSMVLNH